MSVRRTVSEILSIKSWSDPEIGIRGHSRSLKMVAFESLGKVTYSHSTVTIAICCIISEI